MPIDRNEFIFDSFAKPVFSENLNQSIKISGAENFLVKPEPNDIIEFELLDQFSNLIETRTDNIVNLTGVSYENGLLNLDTFEIIANLFKKVRGQYILKVSGYRKYIYEDLYDENDNPVDIENESPNNVIFSTVNVVERSTSGREIRVKPRNTDVTSFTRFYNETDARAIPIDGFYWKYDDSPVVYFAKHEDGYDPNVNYAIPSPSTYAIHREKRGLPGVDSDGNYIWTGIRVVDSDFNILSYIDDQDKLLSETDIWPVYLRLEQPNGGIINLVATNWMYHEYYVKDPKTLNDNEQPEPIDTVIFKLAVPADNTITVDTPMEIVRPLFVPFETKVEIDIPVIIDEAFTQLRGPNLKLDVNKNAGKGTLVKNKKDLVGDNSDIASRLEGSLISGSQAVELNLDFREFKNFVNFSSAEERVKNAFYKFEQIEFYASKSSALSSGFVGSDSDVTGSSTHLSEKIRFDNLRRGLLNSFTPYEKYVYYEDKPKLTIYDDDGERITNAPTYPKQDDERTGLGYNLFSVTSSEAVSWYQATLATASLYDAENVSLLRNTVPTHIKANPDNDSYTLFLDMVGEHFDDLYFRIQSFEEMYRGQENIDLGISKDMILEVAKSFGINLYPGFSSNDLWDYALGTDSSGTYQASGSGETRTFVVKDSHSSNDIEKQQWKRILNNLPLLMKTKGTARGIRALLATYGIPLTILNIDEYGGAPAERKEDKREIQKFNYAMNFSGSSNVSWFHQFINPGTIVDVPLSVQSPIDRFPSMYEFRIDTQTTQSMHLLSWKTTTQPAGSDEAIFLYLEVSSSATGSDSPSAIAAGSASAFCKYGRLTAIISGTSTPALSGSTSYAPFYNNDWWNISIGTTEHPSGSSQTGNSLEVRYATSGENSNGRITHSGSVNIALQAGNSALWSSLALAMLGGTGVTTTGLGTFNDTKNLNVSGFSGSMQELRGWFEYLSEDAFHQHTLAPTSSVTRGSSDTLADDNLGLDTQSTLSEFIPFEEFQKTLDN